MFVPIGSGIAVRYYFTVVPICETIGPLTCRFLAFGLTLNKVSKILHALRTKYLISALRFGVNEKRFWTIVDHTA